MAEDRSQWIPLECNPEVFNSWAEKAGVVPSQAQFQDIYGLDEELLGMVPPQVKAVIFLFPDNKSFVADRQDEDLKLSQTKQEKLDPTIFWMKQTIGNACGTMALIHAIANSDLTIVPESPMSKFLEQCEGKTPAERGHILETTFCNIHAETAASGQTVTPTDPAVEPEGHFTCFVQAPEAEFRIRAAAGANSEDVGKADGSSGMRLVELNGSRGGPIDRGECNDLLRDTAKHVKEKYTTQSPSMYFSMMALVAPDQRTF